MMVIGCKLVIMSLMPLILGMDHLLKEPVMEIIAHDYPHAAVIRVTGRVDAGTYAALENKIKEYLDAGHKHLVLELDGTEYLSSAGVRVLISTQKTLKAHGGRLAIAQPSDRVTDVLKLAGVDVLFPTYATTVAALASE